MQENKPITNVTAGLMIAAILIVYSLILTFADLSADQTMGYITYGIFIIGLIVVIGMHAKANNYRLSFGNLFAFGFKTTAVTTIIFLIFMVILNLIFPELKEKAYEVAREQMESQDNLSDDQIEQGLTMMRKFFWVGLIGGSLIMFLIVGAIGSLIGAAVTKKNQVTPFDEPTSL
jgi:hypothetical protein